MSWRGYAHIKITTELTAAQKKLVKTALLKLGRQNDAQPALITHLRLSLDGQEAIVELILSQALTKTEVCDILSQDLPWTSQQISNNSTFTVLTGGGWEARRRNCVQFLIDNVNDWEEGN